MQVWNTGKQCQSERKREKYLPNFSTYLANDKCSPVHCTCIALFYILHYIYAFFGISSFVFFRLVGNATTQNKYNTEIYIIEFSCSWIQIALNNMASVWMWRSLSPLCGKNTRCYCMRSPTGFFSGGGSIWLRLIHLRLPNTHTIPDNTPAHRSFAPHSILFHHRNEVKSITTDSLWSLVFHSFSLCVECVGCNAIAIGLFNAHVAFKRHPKNSITPMMHQLWIVKSKVFPCHSSQCGTGNCTQAKKCSANCSPLYVYTLVKEWKQPPE